MEELIDHCQTFILSRAQCILSNGTGVYEDKVCLIHTGCTHVAILHKDGAHYLAIRDVHLTAIGFDKVLQLAVRGFRERLLAAFDTTLRLLKEVFQVWAG